MFIGQRNGWQLSPKIMQHTPLDTLRNVSSEDDLSFTGEVEKKCVVSRKRFHIVTEVKRNSSSFDDKECHSSRVEKKIFTVQTEEWKSLEGGFRSFCGSNNRRERIKMINVDFQINLTH